MQHLALCFKRSVATMCHGHFEHIQKNQQTCNSVLYTIAQGGTLRNNTFPQTVLALWGSGVFKAGEGNPPGHGKPLKNYEFLSIFKKAGAGARVF